MASQSTKPPEPETAETASTETSPATGADTRVAEYVGEYERTYSFPGGAQTAEPGDVCAIPAGFDDGRWKPTTRKVTRLRDNDPDQFEATSQRQSKARAKVHAELAKAAKGGE